MAENSDEVRFANPSQMGNTAVRFMKLTGRILEMIRSGHAKIHNPRIPRSQVITVLGVANGPIRTR